LKKLRGRLTYANVVSTICLFILLGGGAYAAIKLPKNSVGTRQIKKNSVTAAKLKENAVTTAKIKDEAVTAAKIMRGTLTGTQVQASTLGPVPLAESAKTAAVASSLAPSEPWHQVGAPGEPGFLNDWENVGTATPTAAFYKDKVGTVHLRGEVKGPPATSDKAIFVLPPGFRPTATVDFAFTGYCIAGEFCGPSFTERIDVVGGDYENPEMSGQVRAGPAKLVSLNAIAFRAES